MIKYRTSLVLFCFAFCFQLVFAEVPQDICSYQDCTTNFLAPLSPPPFPESVGATDLSSDDGDEWESFRAITSPTLISNHSSLQYDQIASNGYPPPWAEGYLIWVSGDASIVIKRILSMGVPLLNFTYGQVFTELYQSGCLLYIFGGLVRDALLGIPGNDVDISFTCSPTRLFEIATTAGFQPSISGPYIRIPKKPTAGVVTEYIEGFSVSTSLYDSLDSRDFCLNTVWYDLINQVVIDATGYGVSDALSGTLRIPVEKSQWSDWVENDFKPGAKLFRWFKFRARSYQPSDQETTQFVVKQTRNFFRVSPQLANQAWSDYFQKAVKGKSNPHQFAIDIKNAIIQDFGSNTWYEKNVKSISEFAVSEQISRANIFNSSFISDQISNIIFLGGGTASGKSTISSTFDDPRYIKIDSDQILLDSPQFQEIRNTSKCGTSLYGHSAYQIAANLLGEAFIGGYNIIFDGTMSNFQRTNEYFNLAWSNSYTIQIVAVTLNTTTAAIRNVDRARSTGRWVPLDALVYTHRQFSSNFLKYSSLIPRVKLYDTNAIPPILIFSQDEFNGTQVLNRPLFELFLSQANQTTELIFNQLPVDIQNAYLSFDQECRTNSSHLFPTQILTLITVFLLSILL